jgi:hypothetical protein
VIEELKGESRMSADAQISRAKAQTWGGGMDAVSL